MNGNQEKYHCVITKIKPEKREEYKALHDTINQSIINTGHKYGIRNYSIFEYKDMYVSFFEYVGDNFKADMEAEAQLPHIIKWKSFCDACYEITEDEPKLIFHNNF